MSETLRDKNEIKIVQLESIFNKLMGNKIESASCDILRNISYIYRTMETKVLHKLKFEIFYF